MQPAPRDAMEVLETQIADRLPRPLKGQASSMAMIVLRALGGAVHDTNWPEDALVLDGMKVALLERMGVASPDASDSLATAYNERMTYHRQDLSRFRSGNIEVDQLAATVLLLVLNSPGVSFYYKDLGEVLHRSGRPELAIHWLEFGRRFYLKGFDSRDEVPQHDRIIYSMFLSYEAHCHADLGNFTQAIDLRLRAHALNASDPDFSAVERWSNESVIDEPVQQLQIGGGGRLPALMLAVSGIAVASSSIVGEELTKHVSPRQDLSKPVIIGSVTQNFTKYIPETEIKVHRYRNVCIHTDYWKTAVSDDAGRLLRAVSSGPSELAILAQRTGLGPVYSDLQGTTAVVTFNHNWFEYYHWLIEIAQRVGLILERGIHFDHLIAPGAHLRSYCLEFLSLTGLDTKNVLGGQDPIAVRAAEVLIPSRPQFISNFGIQFLKSLYLGRDQPNASKGRRLLISRQKAKDRKIANYEQIYEVLHAAGFEVVTFEDMDVRTQARMMSEAEIVVAPHGAGLSNVVFCPPGATVIEFLPVGCPIVFQVLSQKCDLDYVAVQSDWSGQDQVVDLDHLRAALRSAGLS